MRDEATVSERAHDVASAYPDQVIGLANVHPLRTFRMQRRLSLESVASAVKVSKATISRIETGRQTPTLGVIERLIEFSEGALSADSFLAGRRQ